MSISIKTIQEVKFSKTQWSILKLLFENDSIDFNSLSITLNVLLPTICVEVKKLTNSKLIYRKDNSIYLTDHGSKVKTFYKFKEDIFKQFCKLNNFDNNIFDSLMSNRNYNNLNLLLGIKNLIERNN